MNTVEHTAEAGEPPRPRTALVASVVIAVLMALLVAVLATRDSSAERETKSPLIGFPAPSVEGGTIDGGTFSLADQRGRWVFLNFFASWCTPCIQEHLELAAFDAAHRAQGDAVLVSATFDDKVADAKQFFADNGGTWPLIEDPENRLGVAFGVAQVPETFVIAPNGVVVQRFAGPVTRAALEEVMAAYEQRTSTTAADQQDDADGHVDGEVTP
jgi:cytochrome c biogenesis protein CcmG/thiol:disulfide interchange protein DsbE